MKTVTVVVDRALVIPAPQGTTTLVVGNPAIADTSIQRNNVIVLTGKSYGTTNLIAIDSSGKTIEEMLVTVRSPEDSVVTVHRGTERESYSCRPTCERTLRMGDSPAFFDQVGAQFGARNGFAQQGQAGQGQSR
ncbi:pilus assembly protein N-terminal domain-containing protein [Agaricicola taiwanensis]|nr:pilus assembly protein N-terminal domain-containing protein [Agaricicola taiwanensis]